MARSWALGRLLTRRGQYLLEWTTLFAVMAAVVILMAPYVRRSVRANVKSTEVQINGSMLDNRP